MINEEKISNKRDGEKIGFEFYFGIDFYSFSLYEKKTKRD